MYFAYVDLYTMDLILFLCVIKSAFILICIWTISSLALPQYYQICALFAPLYVSKLSYLVVVTSCDVMAVTRLVNVITFQTDQGSC